MLGDACWLTMRVDDTCWVVSIGLYFLDCISCIVFLVSLLVPNYEQAWVLLWDSYSSNIFVLSFFLNAMATAINYDSCFDPFK